MGNSTRAVRRGEVISFLGTSNLSIFPVSHSIFYSLSLSLPPHHLSFIEAGDFYYLPFIFSGMGLSLVERVLHGESETSPLTLWWKRGGGGRGPIPSPLGWNPCNPSYTLYLGIPASTPVHPVSVFFSPSLSLSLSLHLFLHCRPLE